jgi:gamma-glutamyl-gamma-aminobutyraldehyde dehydrogenase/4-guanidinobutyraldehyde dehydrogenase/NAD-dependent aldehyde dehydrogenase
LPTGVFNVVPGFGAEVGSPLALHRDVDAIGFTGSTKVGKQIHVMAGQSNLKRAWTELGGKSAFIVMDDCLDLDRAAQAAVSGNFFNQGQSCNAPSRLLVHNAVKQAFTDKVLQLVPKYQPTDPLHGQTIMGALVDKTQLNTVMGYIEKGRQEGALLIAGGAVARTETGGFYVQPTVFDGVSSEMTIAREEIFGPVAVVYRVDSLEEAIALGNDTPWGLGASIWAEDPAEQEQGIRDLEAGMVFVNAIVGSTPELPFGGIKRSGYGRELSGIGMHEFCNAKTFFVA